MLVFGEVKGHRVVYAYPDDQVKATEVNVRRQRARVNVASDTN